MKKLILTSIAFVLNLVISNFAIAVGWNFDFNTTGVPPASWSEYYAGGGGSPLYTREEAAALGVSIQVDNTVTYNSSGNSVHFLDSSNVVSSQVSNNFGALSSLVLDFYMLSNNSAYEGAFVQLEGDAGVDWAITFGGESGGGTPGYIGIMGPGSWINPTLLAYTENTWYHVTRTLTLNGDGSSSGTFYVEEANNSTNSNSFNIDSFAPNTTINRINIFTSWSQGADAYIDNISVAPEPISSILFLTGGAVLGARNLIRRRKATT